MEHLEGISLLVDEKDNHISNDDSMEHLEGICKDKFIKISGTYSYYYFKIPLKDGYKKILIFSDSHSIYKKQPDYLDLIKFYKLCIIESNKNKQCLDLFMESFYQINRNIIIKTGGDCNSDPDECVSHMMIDRLRTLFLNGQLKMLTDHKERLYDIYKDEYYTLGTKDRKIKLDYTRFHDWDISYIKTIENGYKSHFVWMVDEPENQNFLNGFSFNSTEFIDEVLMGSIPDQFHTSFHQMMDDVDYDDEIIDTIKYILKSLFYFFIGESNDIYTSGEDILSNILEYIENNKNIWYDINRNYDDISILEYHDLSSLGDIDVHIEIAKKVKKQLDNIDTDYFTKDDLINHFITRIDNMVNGTDAWDIDNYYDIGDRDNIDFIKSISTLRLFFTDIYSIARMFRNFMRVDRHKCDMNGSLSNIIWFGGDAHSTNLKYFLEQQFGIEALYKQLNKNDDEDHRYIRLDSEVLKDFGWDDIVNWNDSKYETITSNENILE